MRIMYVAGFHAQLQYEDKKSSSVCKILAGPLLNSSGSRNLKHFGKKRAWGPKKKKKIPGVIVVPSQMVLLFC